MNLHSRRHWVIGDVHGCHQPLCQLLATLPPNDHLVFCGDVINRGEAIPATMNLVWDLSRPAVPRGCAGTMSKTSLMPWNPGTA